jgi:sortase (surface protein transpeptidase)
MEAGYDYTLFRGRLRRHLLSFPAIFFVIFGLLLILGSVAYYGYANKARADLPQLTVVAPPANAEPPAPVTSPTAAPEAAPADAALPVIPGPAMEPLRYSGEVTAHVAAWPAPSSHYAESKGSYPEPQDFTHLDASQGHPLGSLGRATRLILPALGIDTGVQELPIMGHGDSRVYQTPVNSVGHIPESANAGEAGSSWFFGHLESPILGQGSVFYELPKVAEMLRQGEEVHLMADNGSYQYLYRITSTQVVHQDELRLEDSGMATIHLVACVPALVYDHRLVVTGELAGFN